MADYYVREEDGTSKYILEDASGDYLLEIQTTVLPGFISSVTTLYAPTVAYTDTTTASAAGTYSWLCPVGITQVYVECYGGGGPAADVPTDNQGDGGGGGGAYAARVAVPVTAGTLYTLVVGAHGTFGNDGASSTFTGNSSVQVIAVGGGHATNLTKGTGGAAGSSTGDSGLVHSGGDGGAGATGISAAGAGGGASGNFAATGANGGNAVGAGNTPGAGGVGANGGGTGDTGAFLAAGPPAGGSAPGAGGGGSCFGVHGSAGYDGKVVITTQTGVNPPFISSVTVVYVPVVTSIEVDPPFIASVTLVYTPTLMATFTGGGVSQVAFEVAAGFTTGVAYVSQVTLEIVVPQYKGLHVWQRS